MGSKTHSRNNEQKVVRYTAYTRNEWLVRHTAYTRNEWFVRHFACTRNEWLVRHTQETTEERVVRQDRTIEFDCSPLQYQVFHRKELGIGNDRFS